MTKSTLILPVVVELSKLNESIRQMAEHIEQIAIDLNTVIMIAEGNKTARKPENTRQGHSSVTFTRWEKC